MLFTHLKTSNFLGLPSLHVAFAPFTLFAGPNGTGKSAIRDAIKFALDGLGVRDVDGKKNYAELLTDGADKGYVEIGFDGRDIRRNIVTGAIGKVAMPPLPDCLPWLLEPGLFASLSAGDKRKGLSRLLGLQTTLDAIIERLEKHGVPVAVCNDLRTPLSRGFEEAEKHANTRATEARGAWKQLTGQNYGSKVAEDWEPGVAQTVTFSPKEVLDTLNAKREIEGQLGALNQAIGAASRQLAPERRKELQEWADKLPDYEASEARGVDVVNALVARIKELEPIAQGNLGTTLACPHCAELVVMDAGQLRKAVAPDTRAQLDAHTELVPAREKLAELQGKMATLKQTINTAREAKATLASDSTGEPVDIAALREELATKQARLVDLNSLAAQHRSSNEEHERLAGLGEKAKAEHEKVLAYVDAAEQLSPNGIPATLLSQVLDPFNAELARISSDAGWPLVSIDADMVLRIGPRRYGLASESFRWRIDAVLARAFATFAKFPVLILDRLDVLDVPTRGSTIAWLQAEAAAGVQVIVGATLKAVPPSTEGVTWVWLDAKVVGAGA